LTFNINIEQAFLLSSELGKLRVPSLLTNVGRSFFPATQRRNLGRGKGGRHSPVWLCKVIIADGSGGGGGGGVERKSEIFCTYSYSIWKQISF
jgi:hypothetical protein